MNQINNSLNCTILLIDFSINEAKQLSDQGYQINTFSTNWVSGKNERLKLLEDTKIIFWNASIEQTALCSTASHVGDGKYVAQIVENGGIAVIFVGNASFPCLSNLFSVSEKISPLRQRDGDQRTIFLPSDSFCHEIFARFGNSIQKSNLLYVQQNADYCKLIEGMQDNELKAIAFGGPFLVKELGMVRGEAIACVHKKEKGIYLLLPHFGFANIEVVKTLLNDIFPAQFQNLYSSDPLSWIYDPEFRFKNLENAHQKLSEEESRHKQAKEQIQKEIESAKRAQELFTKLLYCKDKDLIDSVKLTFDWLGYQVFDADEHRKKLKPDSFQKEEDLWIFCSGESDPLKNSFWIAEVTGTSNKNLKETKTAKIPQYVTRRIKEFKNPNITGILIANPNCLSKPDQRFKEFTDKQIQDSQDSEYIVLSTRELFKFVKAINKKEMTKSQFDDKMHSAKGLLKISDQISL